MPQLDPTFFAPQIFWLIVTFAGLYLLMARVALPRISETLLTRDQRIANDLDVADRLNQEAQEALAAYEATLVESRNKAHELAQETRARIQKETEAAQAEAEARLAARAAEAEAQIAAARDEAMTSVREIASGAAAGLVEKLIGAAPSDDALASAIDLELRARDIDA